MNKALIALGVTRTLVRMNPLSGYPTVDCSLPGRVTETCYRLIAESQDTHGQGGRSHRTLMHSIYAAGESPTSDRDEQTCRALVAFVHERMRATYPARHVTFIEISIEHIFTPETYADEGVLRDGFC